MSFSKNKNTHTDHGKKHENGDDKRYSVFKLAARFRIDQYIPDSADTPEKRKDGKKIASDIKYPDIHDSHKKQLCKFRLKARMVQAVKSSSEEDGR